MKITYFGHSAFQIQTGDSTLLFDPFITDNGLAEQVVRPGDLKPDVVLLTHAHGDHWGDTPEIAHASRALVIGNWEITEYIKNRHGHENVHAMNTGGTWEFPWGRVKQTYARHSSSFPDGTYGGNPNGYLLYLEGKTIYNAGDTCAFAEMAWIGEEESIDLALLPIGDNFTMGLRESVRAATMLKPRLTVPVHYRTFPLIEVDTGDWQRMMQEAGFEAQVLDPGETLSL